MPSTAVAENDGVVSTELESNHSSAGESDEDYETYTWCGQTRIRATTMLGMFSKRFPNTRGKDKFNAIINDNCRLTLLTGMFKSSFFNNF